MKIVVGDRVRVHFHPPGRTMSFVEGVVGRVAATASEGTLIVIDVTREVILDRERPVRRGYQEYILYEHWSDFPGQIEMLPSIEQERVPASAAQDASVEIGALPSQDAPEEVRDDSPPDSGVTFSEPQAQHDSRRGSVIAALLEQS